MKVVNGITITKRFENEDDVRDGQENFMNRDITHLSEEFVKGLYSFRLTDEQKDKVHKLFSETFEGTKTYHNYTRDMKPE